MKLWWKWLYVCDPYTPTLAQTVRLVWSQPRVLYATP